MNDEFTESFNLGYQVKSQEGSVMAFLSAQVGLNCTNINISVQVIDKALLKINEELFRTKYFEFLDKVNNTAINNGWDILKEKEEEEITTELNE